MSTTRAAFAVSRCLIYCRGFSLGESWDIKIEKKILSTRTLAFDEEDEDNDLIDTVSMLLVTWP